MATDSTNLPQGEATLDVGMDITGSDLDLTVQTAASDPAKYVDLPKGNTVILLPVQPGQTIKLPTDSTDNLLAKIGPEGNLAIVVDGRTIILQGYLKANDQSPIKIVTNDGDSVDVADVIAKTDPTLDIQTAAGPASGDQGDGTDSSGIYVPFLAGPGLDGLLAAGILDPTSLQYRLIDDEYKLFTEEEDTGPGAIDITFDILGGIVNEDDLGWGKEPELQAAKIIVDKSGFQGIGNDPFDFKDREDEPGDEDGQDKVGNADPDPEPLQTVATVKVNFGPDVPGTLSIDKSELPTDLTSEGQPIVYEVQPAGGGQGNGIVGFVDNNKDGKFDGGDRLVFDIKVQEDSSPSEFHVVFTLHDNIDNAAPDENGDGSPDLLGGKEQLLDLPVKLTVEDSDGTTKSAVMQFQVEDDIPFFGQVHTDDGIFITNTQPAISHDETPGVDGDANDVDPSELAYLIPDLPLKLFAAGYDLDSLPFESKGALPPFQTAQTQIHVSFGADGPAVFNDDPADKTARDSIYGAISGDGENEHPFELFMIDATKGATPAEDNKSTGPVEGNLTVDDQPTNATVTWFGKNEQVFLDQIDAHTIVGYILVDGEVQNPLPSIAAEGEGEHKEMVFVLHIDDDGVLSFVQFHQINHAIDGSTPEDHDDSAIDTDQFLISAPDGTPIIHVRATDFDGDHVSGPVNLEIQDDGPKFCEVDWGCDGDSKYGKGVIDEEGLKHGIPGGPGDNSGWKHADGKVVFNFGADQPGHVDIQALTVKDHLGNVVLTVTLDDEGKPELGINNLQAIDGQAIEIKETLDGDNVVWTAYIQGTDTKVFSFSLDSQGYNAGEFDFCLYQPLEHPLTDNPSTDKTETSYEDNFRFDFTVRGTDVDGDYADGNVCLSVDDDSPDACKVEISFCDEDNKLVHDETGGVQIGGKWFPWDHDPDASKEPEDDTWYVKDFGKFEKEEHCLDPIGYAKTELKIDLSGNSNCPTAAFGADGPGSVSPVSLVTDCGKNFCGEKTNLKDTKTGCAIFLYTEEVCGESFVVGRVGGKDGPVSFALTVSDCGDLELAQYRAIQHPDGCDSDESLKLLDCEGNALIHLQVTVTDADGDSVVARQPVDGCHGNPSIVFQDDGPTVCATDCKLTLAMDESASLSFKDYNDPNYSGIKDGSTPEGDVILHALDLIKAALHGLPVLPLPIGAAADNVKNLFKVDFGTDGGCTVCYDLTILCGDGKTNLIDTETGTCVTLTKNQYGIVEGRDGQGNLVLAIWLDPDSGDIVSAQYRAIDHGDGEAAPGAHDEVKFLGDHILGVTATAFDKDGDHDSKTVDIGCGISIDDDGPKFKEVDWDRDGDSKSGTGLIDEDALPYGIPGGPGDDDGGKSADGKVVFDFGVDKPPRVEINALEVKDANNNVVLKIALNPDGNLNVITNNLLAINNEALSFEKSAPDANGVVTWSAYINGDPAQKVFTFSLDTAGADIGEFDFCLLQPLEHPYHDADSKNNGPEKSYEDNFKFDFTVRGYDGDGDSADGHVKLSVDDDSPTIESCETEKLHLAMDETDRLQFSDYNQPGVPEGPLDGPTPEADLLSLLVNVFDAIFPGPIPHVLSAAKDNVSNLFKVNFGADGGCVVCYDLTILCGDGKTNLKDTETGDCITLVDCGGGVVKGVTEGGEVVFAIWLDHDSGQIITAQFRAIDHGDEEAAPGAHDEIAFLGNHILGVTATATDNDGDTVCKTVDIGCGISFEDDGPKFEKIDWGNDNDSTSRFNGTGVIDEDALPNGIVGGPGDGNGNNIADGQIFFDLGSDHPGALTVGDLKVTDGSGNSIALVDLKTADDHAIVISQTTDPATGIITLVGKDATDNLPVFTLTLDGAGANIGDFKFELHQPLEHPDTNNNNADDATDDGKGSFEDNLNFSFTVTATDGDGDSATAQIKITIDDDSPKIVGQTEGCLDEACFEKTGECVSIDAADGNVNFSGPGATNGAIIISAIHQGGFSDEEVVKNSDNNGIPGFGIESNGDGGSDERYKEINYTGDGSPFDTPGEVLSVKLANPDQLAACATVELSEFYNGEGGVGAERGQYQLFRDGVPVSGWIAFVGQTPLNATPGSGILTLNIDGPQEGFDEIRFRAIVGTDDGNGGDSSDFNVKSAKFDLGAIEPECITGPINGLYGADGPGDITLINANLPAITVDGVPVVVTVALDGHSATGAIGGETIFTLTIDPVAKTYKFEIFSPIDNNPDGEKLTFGYSIVDADGDKVQSNICITVKDEGKPSVGEHQATAQVDEDGLPAGIGDSAPGDQATDPAHNLPNESYWRGEIVLDGGCDGLQDIALSTTQPTGVKTLDGQDVKTVWDAGTHTLTGYVGADPNNAANKVFTITLDENPDGTPNGSYVLQLLKPVKHADGNQENDVGFNVTVTVTDNDGSTATGTLPVNIDDDIPTLCVEVKWDGRVQHDETPGVDDGTDDDDTGAKVPSYFVGIPGAGAIIGWAEDEEGESSVSIDVDFGADGKGSLNYELDIPGAGTPSGVQTTDGKDIFLFEEGSVVVGRVGNGGPDAAGAVAFAVHVDSDDGDLQVAQFLSLKHPDTGSHDETIDLINSALQVKVTATDKDNDPVSQSVNIGDLVRFDDDGPEAKIEKKHGAEIRLDESKDAAAVDGPADPNANDEANSPGDLTDIAYKTVAGSSLFTVEDDSYGSDGAGSKVFSLIVNGANSGLDDTATGKDVILSQSGNVVTGRAGPGAGDPIVFTITIDPTDGDITVAQFRAVKHDNSSDPDEAGNGNGVGTDEPQTMSSNALLLNFTVTDGDNDKDSSSIDLGKLFRFEDDGPIARDDTDTVSEGIIQPATGNVISGVDGVLGVDENGEDGVIDDLGTDGFQSIAWQSIVGNTVQGKYGTLTVDANGNYRYDLNEADPDLVTLDTGESDYEEFKYTIKDGDGDTDSAILKIKVNGLSDTSKPNFEDENALVDEDGLPAGVLNDPTAPTNDPALGDDVGGHQEGGLPAVASEAIFRDSLNINWDANVGTIAFSVTNADLANIHPLSGAVLTTANVSGNGTGDLGVWDGTPGASNLIMTVKVIDAATSVYEVQLLQPIQHTDPASEDNKSLPVKVTATNAGGTSEHTLTIGIDDDRPVAENDSIAATPGTAGTADVLFIVDVSGSMTNGGGSIVVPDVPGFSDNRLGLARYSMQQLLLTHPEILNVQFVKFDNNVSSSIWMTRAAALLYIAEDTNFAGGGTTNYDIALQEAMDVYGDSPRPAGAAEQTLVYFLSDGQPNTPDDDEGITGNGAGPNVSVTEWETFVATPANNITNVFAIGLGTAVVSQLEPIAYPNDDANAPIGDEDRVIVIPDANITALTQTLDDLLGSVVTPLTGDVTDNDDFGADGAGSPKLVSVTYNGVPQNFGPGVTELTIDLGVGKGTLKIEDDGDYTYTPPAADGADGDPFFVEYTIRDGDGDTVTGKINIDLTVAPTTNNVLAAGNEDSPAGIPVTLTGADSDGTVASFKIISLPANGTLFADALLTIPLVVGSLVPAASNTVYFVPNANYNGATAFNYAAVDNNGVQDASPATADITVNPVNDAPDANITAPSYNATEQTPLALHGTGLSISDIDAGSGDVTVTLSVGFGILSVTAGNSGVGISGNNSSSVTLTGTVAEINSLLNDSSTGTINYNANSDTPPSSTQLTLHVNDEGNTGGGDLTDSAVVTINITDAPEAPEGVNDRIYTNIGVGIAVNDSWLLKNDKDADTAHASLIIASVAAAGGQATFFENGTPSHAGTTTTIDLEIGAGSGVIGNGETTSFDYVVKDPVLQDTANVSVTYDTSGSVNGSANDDILIGFNVGLQGAGGNDQIAGTGTTDLLDFSEVSSNWGLTLGAGGAGTASINGEDTYEGIDGVIGGTGNNQLTGNDGNNILNGGDGSDTLNGNGGDDQLFGGEDGDTLIGGAGADTLDGGEGGDTLDGGKGADTFNVDDGNDTILYNAVANLDAADVVTGFDNIASGGHDTVDLDVLFDNLGVATGDRAARVSVVDVGSNTELRVDLDNNGSDETTILVFQGLGETGNFTFGNDADNDVKLGTLI